MPNYLSRASSLVDEACDILKHDNIDTRAYTWLTATYNDVISRAPSNLFWKTETLTITANTDKVAFGTVNSVGNPISLICQEATTGLVYFPRYTPMTDFSRTAHSTGGSALATGSIPLLWSIGPADAGLEGKTHLYIYPVNSANDVYATIFYTSNRKTAPVASTDYISIPYHFEHVLIWGVVAKGYKTLRPAMYPIAQQEYEQALSAMYSIVGYRPDEVPVLRSIDGPYAGTKLDTSMGRYPTAQT